MLTYSEEHKIFLKKWKKDKILITFSRCFILLLFLSLWELCSSFQIINSFLYSSPSRIFKIFFNLIHDGSLFCHIGITIIEVITSFSLSTILGIFTAFLLWRFPKIAKIMDPYFTIMNSLPKVALGPLIIIWFGAGISSIIFMALFISLFSTIVSLYHGFLEVSPSTISLFKSFHATPLQTFRYLIFPSSIDTIKSTLKINISLNLTGVIMGELLVSKKGLGYLIMYGSQVFQLDLVISSIFLLGILSYFMYLLLHILFYIIQWKELL